MSTTRNMLCAAALAPVVALIGAAPVQAATDGPTATLLKGVTSQTPVASLLDPVVAVPAGIVDGLISTAQGTSQITTGRDGAQDVVAQLGETVMQTLGLKMDALTSKCTSAANGAMKGATTVIGGTAVDKQLPTVPIVGMKVPLADGALATFNRQVMDAKGALTVTGASIIDKTGAVTDLAITRCVPAKRIASAQRMGAGGVAGVGGEALSDHEPLRETLGTVGSTVDTLLATLLGGKVSTKPLGPVDSLLGGLAGTAAAGDLTRGLTANVSKTPVGGLVGQISSATGSLGLPVDSLQRPATTLPDVLPLGLSATVSGVLGGVSGLPGMLPANITQLLPVNPLG